MEIQIINDLKKTHVNLGTYWEKHLNDADISVTDYMKDLFQLKLISTIKDQLPDIDENHLFFMEAMRKLGVK